MYIYLSSPPKRKPSRSSSSSPSIAWHLSPQAVQGVQMLRYLTVHVFFDKHQQFLHMDVWCVSCLYPGIGECVCAACSSANNIGTFHRRISGISEKQNGETRAPSTCRHFSQGRNCRMGDRIMPPPRGPVNPRKRNGVKPGFSMLVCLGVAKLSIPSARNCWRTSYLLHARLHALRRGGCS